MARTKQTARKSTKSYSQNFIKKKKLEEFSFECRYILDTAIVIESDSLWDLIFRFLSFNDIFHLKLICKDSYQCLLTYEIYLKKEFEKQLKNTSNLKLEFSKTFQYTLPKTQFPFFILKHYYGMEDYEIYENENGMIIVSLKDRSLIYDKAERKIIIFKGKIFFILVDYNEDLNPFTNVYVLNLKSFHYNLIASYYTNFRIDEDELVEFTNYVKLKMEVLDLDSEDLLEFYKNNMVSYYKDIEISKEKDMKKEIEEFYYQFNHDLDLFDNLQSSSNYHYKYHSNFSLYRNDPYDCLLIEETMNVKKDGEIYHLIKRVGKEKCILVKSLSQKGYQVVDYDNYVESEFEDKWNGKSSKENREEIEEKLNFLYQRLIKYITEKKYFQNEEDE